MPARFDLEIPANVAKLDLVEQLIEVAESIGASLPELAVAFAAAHPAVTSVIIGPRTMQQLTDSVKGAELVLDEETLDRIDAIVPPETDAYRADGAWQPPALTDPALRRRPVAERAAS